MQLKNNPGLGELLRYLSELVDQGAEQQYKALNMDYRARYTPVLRALAAGAHTISDITAATYLTQGAVSQTVALMIKDGLLTRRPVSEDARKTGIRLTAAGQELLARLQPRWASTFAAISALEEEIGYPLRNVLGAVATALEQQDFASRIQNAISAINEQENSGESRTQPLS